MSAEVYPSVVSPDEGIAMTTTETNEQLDWLKVGRDYARLALAVTGLGLTSHPLSQALQEYPENAEIQAEFNELLGIREPAKIQMAVRVGRAERAYVARRRDPQDFLVGSVDVAPHANLAGQQMLTVR
jgi:hypothetical protein